MAEIQELTRQILLFELIGTVIEARSDKGERRSRNPSGSAGNSEGRIQSPLDEAAHENDVTWFVPEVTVWRT